MTAARLVVRLAVLLIVLAALGWLVLIILAKVRDREAEAAGGGATGRTARVAPVEVAPVEIGAIELRRIFSGTLEAPARFVVAPKVSGRVVRLAVDLADPVERGQIVAELDDDELVNALAQARAQLAVAGAELAAARPRNEAARRNLERVQSLRERGIATDAEFDEAETQALATAAAVDVAEARIRSAEAEVATAETRLGYTRVAANWTGGNDVRHVAERFVDVGDTVAMGGDMLAIVELDPLIAVVHVTEKDYRLLGVDQPAAITTDAMPGEVFEGVIRRIAPVFRSASRQARVELEIANADVRLKPGMFVRAEILLERVEDAVIVPEQALATRGGETGVFVVDAAGRRVSWRPVRTGIAQGDRIRVMVDGEPLGGRVVTLGHQLVEDGSAVVIPGAGAGGGE